LGAGAAGYVKLQVKRVPGTLKSSNRFVTAIPGVTILSVR
jgi:hypothetical protein